MFATAFYFFFYLIVFVFIDSLSLLVLLILLFTLSQSFPLYCCLAFILQPLHPTTSSSPSISPGVVIALHH